MAVSDPVADMLTKIRNASLAKHESVDISCSNSKVEIIKILKSEGYIKSFSIVESDSRKYLKVILKYDEMNNPVIKGIRRLSTPGKRMYSGYKDMPRVFNGYGTLIVSTSDGIITGRKAEERKIGGELICSIW